MPRANGPKSSDLLEQIEELATNPGKPVDHALLLMSQLAIQLDDERLRDWTRAELEGYHDLHDRVPLPAYRKKSHGRSVGATMRSIVLTNTKTVPFEVFPEEKAEVLRHLGFADSVTIVAKNIRSSTSIRIGLPASLYEYVPTDYEYREVESLWVSISPAAQENALNAIRRVILEYVRQIRHDYPAYALSPKPSNVPDPAQLQQNVSIVVLGDVAQLRTAPTVETKIERAVIVPGDPVSVLDILRGRVLDEDLDGLEDILESDDFLTDVDAPKGAFRTWLKGAVRKVSGGTTAVARKAIEEAVILAVRAYAQQTFGGPPGP